MQEVSVGLWMTQPPLFLLGGSGRGVTRPGVPGRINGVGARLPTKDADKGELLDANRAETDRFRLGRVLTIPKGKSASQH